MTKLALKAELERCPGIMSNSRACKLNHNIKIHSQVAASTAMPQVGSSANPYS